MLKKGLKILWNILEIIVIVYVIFMTAYILCRNKFGFTQFNKYTFVTLNEENYKFVPNYNEGDLLVIESKKFDIDEGSTIYYYVVVNNTYVVRSSVVKSKVEDEFSVIYYLDDEKVGSVSGNRVIGEEVKFSSNKGSVLEFLEGKVGFLIFVLLPVMLIFIYRIYDLFVSSKYRDIDVVEEVDEEDSNNTNISSDDSINNNDNNTIGINDKNVSVNTVEVDSSTLENKNNDPTTNYFDNINKPIISEKTGFGEVDIIVEDPQLISNVSVNEDSSEDETEIL